MCGIAGAVGAHEVANPRLVEGQLRLLDHRGPDSWGVHVAPGAVIGQTRLAVIDVVTGDPPIVNEDGTVGVALNGEIYDYRELREGLRQQGHTFASSGDTEVIAHLAEGLEPPALAASLQGMFAFAVWDDRRRRLVLGRDRLGKKPLYYWHDGRSIVFGSEIKAVLAHPAVARRMDYSAIAPFLAFGYVPTPGTFYDGIQSLPPGSVLTFDGSGPPQVKRYWEPPGPGSHAAYEGMTLQEAAASARLLLAAAVERRLVADVPLGAFLSGGIDSGAIVALMAQATSTPVRTFTIGFEDDSGFDEREYARMVSRHCGTDHVEFVVKPDAVDLVEQLVWHYDQPFGDSSAVPTFLLSELTRRDVTVALCGDGGDEVFAGYERFAAAMAISRYQRLPKAARDKVRGVVGALPREALRRRVNSVQRFVASADLPVAHALRSWVASVPDAWRDAFLGENADCGLDAFEAMWSESAGSPVLTRLLDLNLRTYLLDDLLPKVDRMSMAHALEVRAPFLDTELVEFCLRIPPALHLRGFSRKRVLKAAVRDLLPAEVIRRRKRGFGVPLDRWFRTDLKAMVDARLGPPDARIKQHLAPVAVDDLVKEHASGAVDHGQALWALLTLELFLRREGG